MCLLFMKIFEHVAGDDNEYISVIIANNRDEYYARPTAPSDFHWTSDFHGRAVGGKDLQQGACQGSWLAISESGRFACLLNVLQRQFRRDAESRGGLVVDYVSSDVSTGSFLDEVDSRKECFNGFHLVCLEYENSQWNMWHYGNKEKEKIDKLGAGTYGFDNSHRWSEPWMKRTKTCNRFSQIIGDGRLPWNRKESLIDQLIEMLRDETRHGPDVLIETNTPTEATDPLTRSATFVCDCVRKYGTRTHTVIFISTKGNVEYIEYNLEEPIDVNNFTWQTRKHTFNIRSKK